MSNKRVLSIGQCAADEWNVSRTIQQHLGAEVESTAGPAEALARLRERAFDLVLVNRVLDADGSSGLDLIGQIKADEALRHLPVMLVSNYEDAQRRAEERGALPGFGKAALRQPRTIERLKAVLG